MSGTQEWWDLAQDPPTTRELLAAWPRVSALLPPEVGDVASTVRQFVEQLPARLPEAAPAVTTAVVALSGLDASSTVVAVETLARMTRRGLRQESRADLRALAPLLSTVIEQARAERVTVSDPRRGALSTHVALSALAEVAARSGEVERARELHRLTAGHRDPHAIDQDQAVVAVVDQHREDMGRYASGATQVAPWAGAVREATAQPGPKARSVDPGVTAPRPRREDPTATRDSRGPRLR